jgi:hypothetical protein
MRAAEPVLHSFVNACRDLHFRGKYRLLSPLIPQPETAVVKRFLKRGQATVDVGANIGYYTSLFASLIAALGRVLAVELAHTPSAG